MAYCTKADILEQVTWDLLVQLTDDENVGVVVDSRVDRAIADADAEIDSYCGVRYGVPFVPAPARVRNLSVDIAIYRLYARRLGAPDTVRQTYDDAIAFLKNVSIGKGSLGSDTPADDGDTGPESTSVKSDRIFTVGRSSDGSTGTLDNY